MEAQAIDEAKIREAAYFLWIDAGCPEGRDEEYWFAAQAALAAEAPSPRRRRAAAKGAAKSTARRAPARPRKAPAKAG